MTIVDNDPIKDIAEQAGKKATKKPRKAPTKKVPRKEDIVPHQKGSICTIGTVDSRHGMTRKKNVSIRESIYQYINDNTDGRQNVTLILNDLLQRGIASIESELVEGDVKVLGN